MFSRERTSAATEEDKIFHFKFFVDHLPSKPNSIAPEMTK